MRIAVYSKIRHNCRVRFITITAPAAKSFHIKYIIVVSVVIFRLLLIILACIGTIPGTLFPFSIVFCIEHHVISVLYNDIFGAKHLARRIAERTQIAMTTG